MEVETYNEIADLLKVLGHPARLCIVDGLLRNPGCNVTYMQSCLSIPQSTVSQHIAKLKSAHIIEGKREGLEIKYKVVHPMAILLIQVLLNDQQPLPS